jgi:hypothetical protein
MHHIRGAICEKSENLLPGRSFDSIHDRSNLGSN